MPSYLTSISLRQVFSKPHQSSRASNCFWSADWNGNFMQNGTSEYAETFHFVSAKLSLFSELSNHHKESEETLKYCKSIGSCRKKFFVFSERFWKFPSDTFLTSSFQSLNKTTFSIESRIVRKTFYKLNFFLRDLKTNFPYDDLNCKAEADCRINTLNNWRVSVGFSQKLFTKNISTGFVLISILWCNFYTNWTQTHWKYQPIKLKVFN